MAGFLIILEEGIKPIVKNMINPFSKIANQKSSRDVSLKQLDAELKEFKSITAIEIDLTSVDNNIQLSMDSFNYDNIKNILEKISNSLKKNSLKKIYVRIIFGQNDKEFFSLTNSYLDFVFDKGTFNILNLDLYDTMRHRFPKSRGLVVGYDSDVTIDIASVNEAPRVVAEVIRVILNDFLEDFPKSIKVSICLLGYLNVKYEFDTKDKSNLDNTVVNSIKFMSILSFCIDNPDFQLQKISLVFKEVDKGKIAYIDVFSKSSNTKNSIKIKEKIEELFPNLNTIFSK